MTDPKAPLYTPEALPKVATGMRQVLQRLGHGVLCAVVPGFVRHWFGVWSWKEVVNPKGGYDPLIDPQDPRFSKAQPVDRLVRWGIPFPPKLTPWPKPFQRYSKSWNMDNLWDWMPPQELRAWAYVWGSHPKGQHGLDAALTGLAGVGNAGMVDLLLKQGANPNAHMDGLRTSMENLWCAEDPDHQRSPLPMEKVCATWSAFLNHGSQLDWTALEEGAYRPRSLKEYQSLLETGLPLPPPSVLNAWGAAVVNDPSFGWDVNRDSALLSFLMERCPDLTTPERRGELLAIWVCTARNGSEEHTHESMRRWIQLLAPDGQLPPLPSAEKDPVPRQESRADYQPPNFASWNHVFAQAIFLENFPPDLITWLCSGDPSFQRRDANGHTALDCIQERIDDAHSQSRDAGLASLGARVREWQLDQALPAPTEPVVGRRGPRF